ncbi:MAG: D-tyrosyl-tRNA(Tyr) deacylase [Tannerellaceae bacterium]|jgi:D-tyrosyl-tRNA(Tyr) deacylase|nr:D-tyrosyl-tRNA(Tyr) deacylase [Tannerellaceae bacterium]
MRVVVQRVRQASVSVAGAVVSEIGQGLLVLVGVEVTDTEADIAWLAKKICGLRIFSDEAGLMNRSLADIGGSVLLVSQFTLFAAVKKGNRPSFLRAAAPEKAQGLYEALREAIRQESGREVGAGIFGADMQVALLNDGPVTILIDTQNRE